MPDPMRLKSIILCLTLFACVHSFGQLKSFGSKARLAPQKAYQYSAYVYGDAVREYGLGIQRQFSSYFSMDVSLQRFYTHGIFYKKILQWDYYDLSGYGLSLKPKYMFGDVRRTYVGLNVSFEKLSHGTVPVNYYNGSGSRYYDDYMESEGLGTTIGLVMGGKIGIRRFFLEPFFGMGFTHYKFRSTVHSTTNSDYIYAGKTYPYSQSGKELFFQANLGLKFGVSFKKSKLQKAIDKKFDEVYLPKIKRLKATFDTVDAQDPSTPAGLAATKKRLEKLNRQIIRHFNDYYNDTTWLYRRVDDRILVIDELINKGNQ